MSLLDFILQNRLITLTLLAVGVLMLVGAVLFVVSRMPRRPRAEAAEVPVEEAAAVEEEVIIPVSAAPKPTTAAPAPAAAQPQPEPEKPMTEMQSILASVFTDEEGSARRAVLLAATEPMEAASLVALSQQVLEKLRGRRGAA